MLEMLEMLEKQRGKAGLELQAELSCVARVEYFNYDLPWTTEYLAAFYDVAVYVPGIAYAQFMWLLRPNKTSN